jgi:hypothetical protein
MQQREWVTEMLINKSSILIQGFEKRGKAEEARVYKNLVSHYSKRIDSVNSKLC